jgi:alkylation response protein AidB-like acyl-CoA dehydrogenase
MQERGMFRQDTSEDAAFRHEVRDWLEAHLPRHLRGHTVRPRPAELMPWYRTLSDRGWVAPHWPKQYGGMGATLSQQIILTEELARVSAPQLPAQGLNHLAPILMAFGTEAQKARHLPPILKGEVIWAQGYSEPGSGSDLASLSTRARLEGDRFIINGHKIWQTWAHYSDWMFTLVRTDPEAKPKQAGLSFILIDLKTPGIRTRPIVNIADDDEFSEVFLENVEVPAENLIGELNGGWRIANHLLANERLLSSAPQYMSMVIDRIAKVAKVTGAINDAAFRERFARLRIDVTAQLALFWHLVGLIGAGKMPSHETSMLKIVATENLQAATDMLVEVAGGHGADIGRIATPDGDIDVTQIFLQSRRATIYGGSSEIQRNVLSRRVLGLPGGS